MTNYRTFFAGLTTCLFVTTLASAQDGETEHTGVKGKDQLCMGGAAQCGPTGMPDEPVGSLEGIDPQLAIKSGTIWGKRTINVCWENPSSKNAAEREWTRTAVRESWQSATNLEFLGWQRCPGIDPVGGNITSAVLTDIRIRIEDIGPHVDALGKRLDGMPSGMSVNFKFANWGQSCAQQREYCIKTIAVHEFGHAIGIAHEHNRDDSSAWCTNEPQGTDPDVYVTPWDPRSVMNYCNERWSGEGKLSLLDIQGAQMFYGVREEYSGEVIGQVLFVNGASRRNQWKPVRVNKLAADQRWMFGDLNGDGKADLITFFETKIAGSMQMQADVYFANGDSFDGNPKPAVSAGPLGEHSWLVGDFDGNGADGLFNSFDGAWYSTAGDGGDWQRINSSGVGVNKLAAGDFDGDGKADIFSANGTTWKVSYGGASRWSKINSSGVKLSNLAFGDFDGDGKTDVFRSNGKVWQVSYGGASKWTQINSSGVSPDNLRIADINGDGASDVIRLGGGVLRASYGGKSKWTTVLEGVPDGDIVFADFNGDGTDDLFVRSAQ